MRTGRGRAGDQEDPRADQSRRPYYPAPGAAPPPPPLPDIAVIETRNWWGYALFGVAGAAIGALLMFVLG